MPAWDELWERNKDTFARAYDFIFRKHYAMCREDYASDHREG